MFKRVLSCLTVLLVLSFSLCSAMTYDNRFFPFGQQLYSRSYPRYSNIMVDAFYIFSHESRSCLGPDQELFEMFGKYDLNNIAIALETVGETNPLRSQWRGFAIPFKMRGRVEALGIDLAYNQALSDYFSFGIATSIMNVKSWLTLRLDESKVVAPIAGSGDEQELERDVRQANEELGINKLVENKTGFGDIDAYLRLGKIWHYPEKFRRIDAGIRLGMLIPTGPKRDIDNPASIPFAGNDHFGWYLHGDVEFELKEDVKAGIWGRVTKRLSKTMRDRLPVLKEPTNFGAFVGDFNVDPGLNFMLAPYLALEDIRDGLGISARYVWVRQTESCWRDCRKEKTFPINFNEMSEVSKWVSEYVSLNVFYDFSRLVVKRSFDPRLYFNFDIPVHWFASRAVSKSYRVLLGIEVHF